GHSAGTVTVNDSLTVTGDLTVDADILLSAGSSVQLGSVDVASLDGTTLRVGEGATQVVMEGNLVANSLDNTPIGSTGASSGTFSSLSVDGGYSFPSNDGTVGQVLLTDGSGNLSWAAPPSTVSLDSLVVDDALTISGDLTLGSDLVSASDLDIVIGANTYTMGETLLSVPVPLTVTGVASATSLVSSSLEALAGGSLVLASDNETLALNSAGGVSTSGALSVGDGLAVSGTLSAAGDTTLGTATNYIALDTSVTETLDIATVAEVAITSGAISLSATTTTVTGAVDMTLAQPSMADLSLTGTLTVPAIAATGPMTIDAAAAESVSLGSLEGNVSLGREDAGSISMTGAAVDILTSGTGAVSIGSVDASVAIGGSLIVGTVTSEPGTDITIGPDGEADVTINAGQTGTNMGTIYIGEDLLYRKAYTEQVQIQSDLKITASVVSEGDDILFVPDSSRSVKVSALSGGGLVVANSSTGTAVFSAMTDGVTCSDSMTAGSIVTGEINPDGDLQVTMGSGQDIGIELRDGASFEVTKNGDPSPYLSVSTDNSGLVSSSVPVEFTDTFTLGAPDTSFGLDGSVNGVTLASSNSKDLSLLAPDGTVNLGTTSDTVILGRAASSTTVQGDLKVTGSLSSVGSELEIDSVLVAGSSGVLQVASGISSKSGVDLDLASVDGDISLSVASSRKISLKSGATTIAVFDGSMAGAPLTVNGKTKIQGDLVVRDRVSATTALVGVVSTVGNTLTNSNDSADGIVIQNLKVSPNSVTTTGGNLSLTSLGGTVTVAGVEMLGGVTKVTSLQTGTVTLDGTSLRDTDKAFTVEAAEYVLYTPDSMALSIASSPAVNTATLGGGFSTLNLIDSNVQFSKSTTSATLYKVQFSGDGHLSSSSGGSLSFDSPIVCDTISLGNVTNTISSSADLIIKSDDAAGEVTVPSLLRASHSSGLVVGPDVLSANLSLKPESIASTGVLAVSASTFALKSTGYTGSHTALEWNDTDSTYMLGDPDNSGSVLVDTLAVGTSLTVDRIVGVGAGVELEHLTLYGSDVSSAGSLSLTAPSGLTLTTNTVTASTADVTVKAVTATTSATVCDITLSAGSVSTGASLLRINSLGVTGDTITSPVTNALTIDVTTVSVADLTITSSVTVPEAEITSKLVIGTEADPNYIVLTSDSITSPDLTLSATSLDINGVTITAGSALTAASLTAASATLSGTLTAQSISGDTLSLDGSTAVNVGTTSGNVEIGHTGGGSVDVYGDTITLGSIEVDTTGSTVSISDPLLVDRVGSSDPATTALQLDGLSVKMMGPITAGSGTIELSNPVELSGSLTSLTTAAFLVDSFQFLTASATELSLAAPAGMPLDIDGSGAMTLGGSASSVSLGRSGVTTSILGTLETTKIATSGSSLTVDVTDGAQTLGIGRSTAQLNMGTYGTTAVSIQGSSLDIGGDGGTVSLASAGVTTQVHGHLEVNGQILLDGSTVSRVGGDLAVANAGSGKTISLTASAVGVNGIRIVGSTLTGSSSVTVEGLTFTDSAVSGTGIDFTSSAEFSAGLTIGAASFATDGLKSDTYTIGVAEVGVYGGSTGVYPTALSLSGSALEVGEGWSSIVIGDLTVTGGVIGSSSLSFSGAVSFGAGVTFTASPTFPATVSFTTLEATTLKTDTLQSALGATMLSYTSSKVSLSSANTLEMSATSAINLTQSTSVTGSLSVSSGIKLGSSNLIALSDASNTLEIGSGFDSIQAMKPLDVESLSLGGYDALTTPSTTKLYIGSADFTDVEIAASNGIVLTGNVSNTGYDMESDTFTAATSLSVGVVSITASGLSSSAALSITSTGDVTLNGSTFSPAGVVSLTTLTVTGAMTVATFTATTATVTTLSVGGGSYSLPTSDGTDGQILVTDGAGAASWATPEATALQPTISATAQEALSAGDPVIMNRLGTLSRVSSYSAGFGPGSDLGREISKSHTSMAEDSHGNLMIVYVDTTTNGAYARLVVPVGGTVIYGPEVEFASSADEVYYPAITYDTLNDCFVIVYLVKSGMSVTANAVVGRVSGTTITVGTASSFGTIRSSVNDNSLTCTFHEAAGVVLVAYKTVAMRGEVLAATVEVDDSITVGTAVEFTASLMNESFIMYDSTSESAILLHRGKGLVVTVSGTVVSLEAASSVGSSAVYMTGAVDPQGRLLVLHQSFDSIYACIGTLSGTDITFGSSVVVRAQDSKAVAVVYDESRDAMVIASTDNDTDKKGTVWVVAITDGTISLGTPLEFVDTAQTNVDAFYSPSSRAVVLSYAQADSNGALRLFSSATMTGLDAGSFVGFASSSDSAAVVTSAGGIVSGLTGLTPGSSYYVQDDGSISEMPGSIPVLAGYAISDSELIVSPSSAEHLSASSGHFSSLTVGDPSATGKGYSLPTEVGSPSQVLVTGTNNEPQWTYQNSISAFAKHPTDEGDILVLDSQGSVQPVVTTNQGLGVVSATFDGVYGSDFFSVAEDVYGNVVQVGRYGDNCALTIVSPYMGDISVGSYETFTAFPVSSYCRHPTIVYHEAEDTFVVLFAETITSTVQGYMVSARLTGVEFVFGPVTTLDTLDFTGYGNADAAYHVGAEAVVFAYNDAADVGYVVACTIGAGDAVECGTPVQHASDSESYPALVYEPLSTHVVLAYEDIHDIKARVVSVTGTVVTLGTAVTVDSGFSKSVSGTLDPVSHDVVVTFCSSSPYNVMGSILTVAGDTVSATTPVVVADGRFVTRSPVTYDPLGETFYVAYVNESDSDKGTLLPCTIQGGDLVADGSPIVYADADQDLESMYLFYSSQARALLLYDENGNVRTYTPESWSTLTGNTYVGVA
ncbi:hypothetical protein KIPB_006171, partial [Kipferlia bialata]